MVSGKSLPETDAPVIEDVSSAEALEFVNTLQREGRQDRQAAMQILADTPLSRLYGVARRIMSDLAKGPPYAQTTSARRNIRASPSKRKASKAGGKGSK